MKKSSIYGSSALLLVVLTLAGCKSDKKADQALGANKENNNVEADRTLNKSGVPAANEIRIKEALMVPDAATGSFTYASIASSMCNCKEAFDKDFDKLMLIKKTISEGKEPDAKTMAEAQTVRERFDNCMTEFNAAYNSIGHEAKKMQAAFKKTCPETGKSIGY